MLKRAWIIVSVLWAIAWFIPMYSYGEWGVSNRSDIRDLVIGISWIGLPFFAGIIFYFCAAFVFTGRFRPRRY